MIERIKQIIEDCEEIQKSNESDYTKQCARLSAYEEIKKIMKGETNGSNTV